MSPKSSNLSSKRQESLKQATLSFATVKRVGSSNSTSKPKNLKPTKPVPAPKSSSSVENTSAAEDDFDDIDLYLSDGENKDEIQDPPDSDATEDHRKPTSPATRAQTNKLKAVKKSVQEQNTVASDTANPGTIPLKASKSRPDDISKTVLGISADEKPELNIKDRKLNKHYAEVKSKMGHLPPGESIG